LGKVTAVYEVRVFAARIEQQKRREAEKNAPPKKSMMEDFQEFREKKRLERLKSSEVRPEES
jgi:hypothetical protein